jgi:hypothetical protein
MTEMKRPKITDNAKFIAKIYEALVTATDFQPGEGTYMYSTLQLFSQIKIA